MISDDEISYVKTMLRHLPKDREMTVNDIRNKFIEKAKVQASPDAIKAIMRQAVKLERAIRDEVRDGDRGYKETTYTRIV